MRDLAQLNLAAESGWPRRLCMVAPYFPPHVGGIERYALNTALRLCRLGWQVAVLTTNLGGEREIEQQDGIDIFRLNSVMLGDRMPIPCLWRRSVRAVLAALRNWDATVFLVHTHLFPICLVGANLGQQRGRPVLLLGHGSGYVETMSPAQNFILHRYEHGMAALLRRRIQAAYGVSAHSNAWWHRFGIDPAGVLHNGIDSPNLPPRNLAARREFGFADDGPLVAFAGRLLPEKGADTAVQAFLKIAAAHPHARLAIAGDGPARAAVQALAGNHPRIHFLGMLDHQATLRLMGATEVFVFPSRCAEGLPTTVLEAGAMGCAVIATPAGGTTEIIASNQYGRVIADSDALATALDELLADQALCNMLGWRLRQHVLAQFDWDDIVDQLSDKLDSFLPSRLCAAP